jgi:flagellar protein FliO/FliZ
MSDVLTAVAWFVAVLAMIPLSLWWLKRSPMGARLGAGLPGPMKMVAQLPLSNAQKLVTVEVGQGEERRWLVLGVAQGGVNLLYSLTPAEAAAGPASPAEGFAQLLSRLKNDGGSSRAP